MSYYTDFEEAQDITNACALELENDRLKRRVWLTASFNEIRITDMSIKHLQNCINKIEKSGKVGNRWREYYLPLLKKELNRRLY